jgi:hypothetical protein
LRDGEGLDGKSRLCEHTHSPVVGVLSSGIDKAA